MGSVRGSWEGQKLRVCFRKGMDKGTGYMRDYLNA